MGAVSGRYVIVCTAAAYRVVNDTLNNIDPTNVGDNIRWPLRLASDSTEQVVGYFGQWAMDDTTRSALNSAVRDAQWSPRPSLKERTPIPAGGTVPAWGSQRVWVFDGVLNAGEPGWGVYQAIAALGLAELTPESD